MQAAGNGAAVSTAAAQTSSQLAPALALLRQKEKQARRIDRLEAILGIAAQWSQTQEMNVLLERMAEAATRLLGAERASIFLWDRANATLVGRPALGVESGELRIPDSTGVVGQVVHTKTPRRVDADIAEEQREIDRRVDKQLSFKTRSLLCVPLVGKQGKVLGAFETINKINGNFTADDEAALTELAAHASIALENTQHLEHLLRTRNQLVEEAAQSLTLVGECPAMQNLRAVVRRVANTSLAVLVLGENGTGKEVVSKLIHFSSNRRNEPFLAVNCAALPEALLESELFGHEKGAFTDAHQSRAGKFELAGAGTLFLDEIGDMTLGGQSKLLRVLEEKVIVRVGGSASIPTEARVIAATNQNLADMVRAKTFRQDLFFRLNTVTIELPPLRERGEDVLLLAEGFLREFCLRARRAPPKFTAAARKRLLGHHWPGNIRELRNMMERVAFLSEGDKVDDADLPFVTSSSASSAAASLLDSLDLPLADSTRNFQMETIRGHIDRARGNMTDAAKSLGLHRSNLYRKMHQLGMQVDEQVEE
jgi:Nif-specific regulatory protein